VVAGTFLSGGGDKLFIPDESGGTQETTSDDDGRFSMTGFAPGPLVVVAERRGRGRSATVSISPQQASAQLDLVLAPTGSLEGRVLRDGRPFPETVVIATRQLRTANFFVMSGPDGRFALDALAPGPQILMVFVNRKKDFFARAVTIEPGQRAHVDLEIPSGTLTLTVEAAENAGVVLASPPVEVRDGDTLATLTERFFPAQPTSLFHGGGRGPVTFEGLAPGRYLICAQPKVARTDGGAPALACMIRELTGSTTVAMTP
jgi:hypothetical protein